MHKSTSVFNEHTNGMIKIIFNYITIFFLSFFSKSTVRKYITIFLE